MSGYGPDFHETIMGRKFYEGTMEAIADALTQIASAQKVSAQKAEVRISHCDKIVAEVIRYSDDLQSVLVKKESGVIMVVGTNNIRLID